LIIVTKDLRVELPPELYLSERLLHHELARWARVLSPKPLGGNPVSPIMLGRQRLMHVVEVPFEDPWRSCPLWVGIRWNERTHPRIRTTLMPADSNEARAWFRAAARREPVTADPVWGYEALFTSRGTVSYVAALPAKRVNGYLGPLVSADVVDA
jgi:hypothetical protein